MLFVCSIEDGYFYVPALSKFHDLLEFQDKMPPFEDVKNAFVDALREIFM